MNVKIGKVRKFWLRIQSNDIGNSSKSKTEKEALTTFSSKMQT